MPRIGLVRGNRASVLSVVPPHLSGPFFSLRLHRRVLTGWVSGETAPGGSMKVAIADESASGYGPHGTVAMDFTEDVSELHAAGLWNGQRVHLEFGPDFLHGTVADNSQGQPGALAATAGRANPARSSPFGRPAGAIGLEPPARNSSCQYNLESQLNRSGLSGFSICSGLPQQTRLDIPGAAVALLSRPELVTLIVAVLSAPPLSPSEAGGSFEIDHADVFDRDP